VDGCACNQTESGKDRAFGLAWRRGRRIVGCAFAGRGIRSIWRSEWAGRIFQDDDVGKGDIAGKAFCGANGEVVFIAAGDLQYLSALKSGAHVERGHGAVEIDVAIKAGTFNAAGVLRLCERGKERKRCCCDGKL